MRAFSHAQMKVYCTVYWLRCLRDGYSSLQFPREEINKDWVDRGLWSEGLRVCVVARNGE